MFHTVLLAAHLVAQAETVVVTGKCQEGDISGPTRSLEFILRGYDDIEIIPLTGTSQPGSPHDSCRTWTLARSALRGWRSARQLAKRGGAVALLNPVRKILEEELEPFRAGDLRLEAEYAQTTIRAAIAAAQDERQEMELLLAHARDLVERLAARGRRALWPRPFNLLAGELWLEVDRYDEAVLAFERAAGSDSGPLAQVGLARAYARLGNRAAACSAYRRVEHAIEPLQQEARKFLATCK